MISKIGQAWRTALRMDLKVCPGRALVPVQERQERALVPVPIVRLVGTAELLA